MAATQRQRQRQRQRQQPAGRAGPRQDVPGRRCQDSGCCSPDGIPEEAVETGVGHVVGRSRARRTRPPRPRTGGPRRSHATWPRRGRRAPRRAPRRRCRLRRRTAGALPAVGPLETRLARGRARGRTAAQSPGTARTGAAQGTGRRRGSASVRAPAGWPMPELDLSVALTKSGAWS